MSTQDVEEEAADLLKDVNGSKKEKKPEEFVGEEESALEEEDTHAEDTVKNTENVEEKEKKEDVTGLSIVTLNV